MADRSDENKEELSIEELNAWNVENLQKYLKNRGVVITSDTRKRDLVSMFGKLRDADNLIINFAGNKWYYE